MGCVMDKRREDFEKNERVSEILKRYNWFFDISSNQYVLESFPGDIKCLMASNYLDGLWYMWQASSIHEGYVVVLKEPTEAMTSNARDWSIKKYGKSIGFDGAIGCYKAMIEAVEKNDE